MLVENWMSKDVVTVDVDDSMQYATRLLKEHNIRGLPVMKNGKLVGVVTDRDLKRASASDANTLEIHELLYLISKIKIKEIMTKNPITIPLDYTIDEAAEILLDNKLSGAPVVDDKGQVVGIITQTDIFRVIVSLTGVRKKGIQFGFQLEDRPGSIKEVADIIRKYGCRLVSILSSHDDQVDYRHVYVRVSGCDRKRLGELKEELKAKANMLYMVDQVERKKEVYQEYERPSGSWHQGVGLLAERRQEMMEYPKYKKVLFCTDFSENSDYAFEFAYGIAKRDEGLLYILHVIPENPQQALVEGIIGEKTVKEVQKNLQEDLDNNYQEHYVNKIENGIRYEIITKSGREDGEILKFAKDEKADIIVLGTHGRTGIEHVFFGSVAEKVLRRSPFPVFVIPCRKKLERP